MLDAGLQEDACLVSRHCTSHSTVPPDSAVLISLPVQLHISTLQQVSLFFALNYLIILAATSIIELLARPCKALHFAQSCTWFGPANGKHELEVKVSTGIGTQLRLLHETQADLISCEQQRS